MEQGGESQLYYMGVLHALEHVALPAISHCFRRDAVYYWRRWTPAPKRILLQVGLAVKEPRTARSLSSRLTARSEELFPLWSAGQMNKANCCTISMTAWPKVGDTVRATAWTNWLMAWRRVSWQRAAWPLSSAKGIAWRWTGNGVSRASRTPSRAS